MRRKSYVSRLSLTVALLALCLLPLGAQGTKETKKSISYFSGRVETVDWDTQQVAQFEKLNPMVNVEYEFQKDASNVIKVKIASNQMPDLSTVVTQDYIDKGLYMDLSDQRFWDRILPSVKDLCTDLKTGKQYKVATNITMGGLFYNKHIFAELGLKDAQSWEEFVQNLETIKKAYPDKTPLFLGGKDSWTLGHLIEFWAHGVVKQQLGIPGSRKAFLDNSVQWDAPNGIMENFAKALLELKDKHLINDDAITATYDNQKEAFASGEAVIINQGMWVVGDIVKLNPEMKSNIGFGPFPSVVKGLQPMVLCAEDSVYAVSATTKSPEAVFAFLNYLFDPATQKSFSETRGIPSAFVDVDANWSPIKDDASRLVKTYVNINFSTEAPSGLSVDDTGRLIQKLLHGDFASPVQFAKEYQNLWNDAYAASH
ncbi:ABC-type sugar transport system, periplasmic component [Sphaerochaeta pleomorpha str. Grapes]|uniref:ABC-type sugar transport system, periplasmic component n=1 Tax=Sphaerochaeta pleomorpha (strain ATCC BAA-1885 / DSM 22778 / Grapes) TaxID=158190 RepID=G8QUM2_SPHPG|nr:extracellular solute-binding protein [Sphaerochaeta pleomorpha]AEV30330.1 ABC-type sugar transport system, periplasmic component [Sphaerochaeta pleomorpha str. Grapes]